jgi:hypothetical protein
LQQGCADPARCTGHERGLAGLNSRDSMDHLPRSDVVEYDCRGLHIRDPIGYRYKMLALAHKVLSKPAVHRKRRNSLTDVETCHAGAKRIDSAGDLVTWDEWNPGSERVITSDYGEVCRAHAGGAHAHAQLSATWLLHGDFDGLQHCRSASLSEHDRLIRSSQKASKRFFQVPALATVRLAACPSTLEVFRPCFECLIHGYEARQGAAIEATLRKPNQHTAEMLALRQLDSSGCTGRYLKEMLSIEDARE